MKGGQSERGGRGNDVDEEAAVAEKEEEEEEEAGREKEREVRSRLPLLPIHTPP